MIRVIWSRLGFDLWLGLHSLTVIKHRLGIYVIRGVILS